MNDETPQAGPQESPVIANEVGIANIANWLTLIRIVLVPIMLWALFAHGGTQSWWRALAWFIFALAAFTDRLDGQLARKRGIGTDLGALLDPIADKALIGAGLIGLSILGDVWWWVTIVILVREIGITVLRFTVLSKKVIPASRGGKAKTLTQGFAIGFYIFPMPHWFDPLNAILMGVAIVLTLVTGVQYVKEISRLRAS
jgi:CDP-diacylglycerol--glycerol-3-phosphate 3-phosphatidyltransferase